MKRHLLATLLIVAIACTDSSAPNQQTAAFGIRPALDTVAAGFTVTFVAERADSTVDAWSLSDSTIARIDSQQLGRAQVRTLAAGTVTITARRQGDSGTATLVILPTPPPPPAYPFTVTPMLDTVKVGDLVTFYAEDHEPLATWTPYQWSVSDSGLGQLNVIMAYAASVIALAPGTLTIAAFHHGDTVRATLVIRDVQPGEWEGIDLGLVDTATSAAATAIADDGTIVGYFTKEGDFGGNYYWRGFVYKDGVLRKLPSLGGVEVPQVIGPSGRIAGRGKLGSLETVLVWDTPDAPPRQLALTALETADVIGVNQHGDVLFTARARCGGGFGCRGPGEIAVTARAVLWRDGVSVDLGSLNDSIVQIEPWTEAKAWNAKGQIVGRSQVRNREFVGMESGDGVTFWHPFLWENGVMRDLGVLAPMPCDQGRTATDCSWGVAVDINADGVVVGTTNNADGIPTAVIWENGVLRDLGVDPGHFSVALAINDRGQVLGQSRTHGLFLWENGQIQTIYRGLYTSWLGLDEGTLDALGPNGQVAFGSYFWKAGVLTTLGESAYGVAVNGRDEVAGQSGRRAMLWRKKP